jgi:hypothetical protein
MTRICWWLVNVTSRLLEPDERDSVLGDFAESGETGGQALCGLSGLIVRREAALWKDWHPWLILGSLVIPLAWLLSIASRITASTSAVYVWFYVNNWDWTLLKYGSFWYILRDSIGVIVQAALVAVPAVWAMRRGAGIGRSSSLVRTALLIAAALAVIGMTVQEPGLGFSLRAYKQLAILHGWPMGVLHTIVYWRVGYFVVSTIGRRWHGRVHPT